MPIKEIPKYPKLHHLGTDETEWIFNWPDDEIVVQEKFDGANFRFWVEDGKLCFGSRKIDYSNDNEQFQRQINYLIETLNPEDLDMDLVYCGEATIKHSLDYNWVELPPFIGFDVLHKDTGMPLGFRYAKKEFERIGLSFVNVVWIGSVRDWLKENMDDYLKSSAYRSGQPEGIVIKNYNGTNPYGRVLFAKFVTEHFREKKTAKFGQVKTKVDDTPYVVETYCTDARIRKIIFKMRDEGQQLDRSMMGKLIKRTIHDILEEEIINIWLDKKVSSLDFKMMAKLVPQKCLGVLDEMIAKQTA